MSEPDKFDAVVEELLPCPVKFGSGTLLCVMDDGGTVFHVESCPAKFRPAVAARLRRNGERIEQYKKAYNQACAENAALKAKLADTDKRGMSDDDWCCLSRIFNSHSTDAPFEQGYRINEALKRNISHARRAENADVEKAKNEKPE